MRFAEDEDGQIGVLRQVQRLLHFLRGLIRGPVGLRDNVEDRVEHGRDLAHDLNALSVIDLRACTGLVADTAEQSDGLGHVLLKGPWAQCVELRISSRTDDGDGVISARLEREQMPLVAQQDSRALGSQPRRDSVLGGGENLFARASST